MLVVAMVLGAEVVYELDGYFQAPLFENGSRCGLNELWSHSVRPEFVLQMEWERQRLCGV